MAPTGAKEAKLRLPKKLAPKRMLEEATQLTPKMVYEHLQKVVDFIRNPQQTGNGAKGASPRESPVELNQCFMDFGDINFPFNDDSKMVQVLDDTVFSWEADKMVNHGCFDTLENVTSCYMDMSPFQKANIVEKACKKSGGVGLDMFSFKSTVDASHAWYGDFTEVMSMQWLVCLPESCSGIEEIIDNFIVPPEFYYYYYYDDEGQYDDFPLDDISIDDIALDDFPLDDISLDDISLDDISIDDISIDDILKDHGYDDYYYNYNPGYNVTSVEVVVGTYENQATFYCTEKVTENFFFKKKKGIVETKTCKQLSMMKVDRIHDFCLANDSVDGYLGAADACPKTCCKCMEKPEPCNRLPGGYYDSGMCSMKGVSFSGKATLKQECPQSCGICPSTADMYYY